MSSLGKHRPLKIRFSASATYCRKLTSVIIVNVDAFVTLVQVQANGVIHIAIWNRPTATDNFIAVTCIIHKLYQHLVLVYMICLVPAQSTLPSWNTSHRDCSWQLDHCWIRQPLNSPSPSMSGHCFELKFRYDLFSFIGTYFELIVTLSHLALSSWGPRRKRKIEVTVGSSYFLVFYFFGNDLNWLALLL